MTSDSQEHYESLRPRDAVGGILFLLGVALLVLSFLSGTKAWNVALPSFWYRNQWLWPFAGILLAVSGWAFQRAGADPAKSWSPSRPGGRFRRVVLYTKPGCHLCDVAKDTLLQHERWLPKVEEIDISDDPQLLERFGEAIPVVEIDGEERFRGVVNPLLLRRLIEASPRVD